MREDKELQEFRNLMTRPDEYEDGFGWGSVIMAFFVGLLMTPAQMYMQLVAGMGLVGAARWVTVILYVEVARRAQRKRPQAAWRRGLTSTPPYCIVGLVRRMFGKDRP